MRNLLMVLKSFFGINASTGSNAILPRFSMYPQRFRYFFLINRKWLEGKCVNGEFYSIDDNSHIKNTKHFIVVYRNGQMAFESKKFRFYPEEVIGLDSFEPEILILKKEEFEKAKFFCRINYSQSPIFPENPQYYETTIQNISNQKIKITSFGAFVETDDNLYRLNTVTGRPFTADDFVNWYMDSAEGWIYPGQSVSDPINYGGSANNWAYNIQTESGNILWFGDIS